MVDALAKITGKELLDRHNEYHLMVVQILCGFDTDITQFAKQIRSLETQIADVLLRIERIENQQMFVLNTIQRLLNEIQRLNDFAENGFNSVWQTFGTSSDER